MHPKSTLGPSLEPDLKSVPITLYRVPQGSPKYCPKPERRRPGTQLVHFCGQNAVFESATVFKRIFVRFLVLFEGSDPKNSTVFICPNQLSLFLQKVSFLLLFGHSLAPKMLTFGIHWRPEAD